MQTPPSADANSPISKLHPVSPHVGMHLDPSIAWGNDEDDYGHFSEDKPLGDENESLLPLPPPQPRQFPPLSPSSIKPATTTFATPRNRKNSRHKKSSSVYAASNTSRMQRTTSKFDLGAMQLSGMGLTHSASTLNFLQNALDDELSAAQLNRVPSWAKVASNQRDAKHVAGFLHTDSKGKGLPWGITSPPVSPIRDSNDLLPKVRLGAILKPLRNGADAIVDDSFWRCFEDREDIAWNWNFYLFPTWCIGVLVRYLILFPIRIMFLIVGILIFFVGFFCIRLWYLVGCNCRCCGHLNHLSVEAGLVRLFALSFVISWSGIIRYHGIRPSDTMKKRVFVANHSSMIDVTMLLQRDNYSLVGQAHKGWIRFIQKVMLESLQCVWFNRGETKDRNAVFTKLQKHARNEQGDLPVSEHRRESCDSIQLCCVFFILMFSLFLLLLLLLLLLLSPSPSPSPSLSFVFGFIFFVVVDT